MEPDESILRQQDELVRSMPRKSKVSFLLKASGLLAGFLFTFMVSRYYGAANFGLFSLALNVLQLLVLFSIPGFESALFRRIATGKDLQGVMYNKMLALTVPLSLILGACGWFGASAIAEGVFHKPELTTCIQVVSVSVLPAAWMLIHASALRGLDETGWFSFFRESARFLIAVPLLAVAILMQRHQRTDPVWCFTAAVFISAFWSWVIWKKKRKTLPEVKSLEEEFTFRKLFLITSPFFTVAVLSQLFPLLNSVLLGVLGTSEEVGVFQVALRVGSVLSLPLLVVNMAGATSFAVIYESGDRQSLQQAISRANRMIFLSALPLLIICLAFPGFIMQLFGSGFRDGAFALVLVSLAQFVNAITGSAGVLMQVTGLERVWGIILFCTTLLNLAGMFILVPWYGLNGAAASYLAVMVVNNLAAAFILKKRKNIRTFYLPF